LRIDHRHSDEKVYDDPDERQERPDGKSLSTVEVHEKN
jgi:hypothetical protein